MTLSELGKWRKAVPVAIFSLCMVPWFLLRSKTLADAKLANEFIVPIVAFVAAFIYVALDLRRPLWNKENEAHVRRQIREALLNLVPDDLAITNNEREQLQKEAFKELTGVFWEAIDQNEVLRSHKEHFYSNGIVYTTSIDAYLICGFSGFIYLIVSFATKRLDLALVGGGLLAFAVLCEAILTPKIRARHLSLSAEQLELLKRNQGKFVSDRFRDIVVTWRRNRLLRNAQTAAPSVSAATQSKPIETSSTGQAGPEGNPPTHEVIAHICTIVGTVGLAITRLLPTIPTIWVCYFSVVAYIIAVRSYVITKYSSWKKQATRISFGLALLLLLAASGVHLGVRSLRLNGSGSVPAMPSAQPDVQPTNTQPSQPGGRNNNTPAPAKNTKKAGGTTVKPISPPSLSHAQDKPPQTQLERLTETNRRLTDADKNRLTTALFVYSELLKRANMLWGKINRAGGQVNKDWNDGSIAQNYDSHRKTLRELSSEAKEFRLAYRDVRGEWAYFQEQASYVFGDNENEGPNTLINATEGFANSLDNWSTIQNKDLKQIQQILEDPQNRFNEYTLAFAHWKQACDRRLTEMRNSIK